MKFNQIADGQQFEYQGAIFTKKGPLMAVDERGNSKLLPRSAVVKPVTAQIAKPPAEIARHITIGQAIQSFELFYAQCINSIETLATGLDERSMTDLKHALDAARQEYLKSL